MSTRVVNYSLAAALPTATVVLGSVLKFKTDERKQFQQEPVCINDNRLSKLITYTTKAANTTNEAVAN